MLLARDYTAKLADVGLAKLMLRDCLSTLRDVRPPMLCAAPDDAMSIFASIPAAEARHAAVQVGTFAWAAPEVLLGQKCTEMVDIYSFGVILWCAPTTIQRTAYGHTVPADTCFAFFPLPA